MEIKKKNPINRKYIHMRVSWRSSALVDTQACCLFVRSPTCTRVWHKAVFIVAQGQNPHMPGGSKNALSPVGIPLKSGGGDQTLLKQIRAYEDDSQCDTNNGLLRHPC